MQLGGTNEERLDLEQMRQLLVPKKSKQKSPQAVTSGKSKRSKKKDVTEIMGRK